MKTWLAIFFGLLLTGCLAQHQAPIPLPAGNISAYKIGEAAQNSPRFYDWAILDQKQNLPANVTNKLRKILADPSTYEITMPHCFEPGMAFRFGDGGNAVDVIICLNCNKIEFRRGQMIKSKPISDRGNDELRDIYQRVFSPDSR